MRGRRVWILFDGDSQSTVAMFDSLDAFYEWTLTRSDEYKGAVLTPMTAGYLLSLNSGEEVRNVSLTRSNVYAAASEVTE